MKSLFFSARTIKLAVLFSFTLALGVFFLFKAELRARASALGPAPTFTSAPGEGNCTACHIDFLVNSGPGSVQVTGLPVNYRPGQTYVLTVTTSQTNQVVYGFESTVLDRTGHNAGALSVIQTSPQRTKLVNGMVNGVTRTYVEHTQDGITPPQFNFNSWTVNWLAPATRIGKITVYAAGNAANSDGGPAGDYIYTTSRSTFSGTNNGDMDGDGKSDLALFRNSDGGWYVLKSSNGAFQAQQFGTNLDQPVAGDYDGDGKGDVAVFRSSVGTWYMLRSSDGAFVAQQFGISTDLPVVGDFDGDGKSDFAVFRPSAGTWYILRSSNGVLVSQPFGSSGDKPSQGDFDADGKTDIAVWRPSTGTWYILRSSNSQVTALQFGATGDRAVAGDYDGDGTTDVAVWRPSTGTWYALLSANSSFFARQFGISTDVPVPSDYDGDGKTDTAIYRSGVWYISNSSDGSLRSATFGAAADVPVQSSGFIPQ